MIALGCDHGGYALKEKIKEYLKGQRMEFKDFGCYSRDSVDYPEFAKDVAKAVQSGEYKRGILICSTGIGISIAANRFKGIRAAVCTETYSAKMTRLHNDANILCLGGMITGENMAYEIIDTFLTTPFSKEEKHSRRISTIELNETEK